MRGALALLVGVVLAACGGELPITGDAGDGHDAGADGAPLPPDRDGGAADAARADARPDAGDEPWLDAAVDASPTTLPDADLSCDECPDPGPCATSACVGGACVTAPVADGLECAGDGSSVCVGGACVARGCGDGYREPGPTPAREACDDGQLGGGTADACDDSCAPRPFAVAWRPAATDLPDGPRPATGVDDAGRALVLHGASISSRTASLVGRRHDARGVVTGAPVVVDGAFYAGWPTEASVLGVADGWVVVWVAPDGDGDGAGLLARRVFADGQQGEPVVVSTQLAGDQRSPALARLAGDRLVIVWADAGAVSADTVLRARLFSTALVPTSGELNVASGDGRDVEPVVAATPSGFAVAWTSAPTTALAVPVVLARRYATSGTPLDAAPFQISDLGGDDPEHDGAAPALAALDDGRFLVVWSTRAADPRGDVRGRRFALSGVAEPSFGVAEQTDFPELLPAVAATSGAGAVVLVHRGSALTDLVRDVAVVLVDDELPVPAVLSARLAGSGRQRLASVVRAASALWFVWGDDLAASGSPSQSTWAFLLPID